MRAERGLLSYTRQARSLILRVSCTKIAALVENSTADERSGQRDKAAAAAAAKLDHSVPPFRFRRADSLQDRLDLN